MIRRLTLEEMVFYKDKIIELFDRNIKKYPPCVDDSESWYDHSLTGVFQLWGIIDNDLMGICLTTVTGNAVNLFGLAGKGILKEFNNLPEILKTLKKEYKEFDMRYIQSLTIPALAKTVWKDCHQRPLVMVTIDTEE